MIGEAVRAGAMQVAKIAVFVAGSYAFSRLVEPRLSAVFARLDPSKRPFFFAAGTVFLIGAVADALGFSMAIGAIFAGPFSRDPAELQIDDAFTSVLALFGPFFFLSVGLSVRLDSFGAAISLAAAMAHGVSVGAWAVPPELYTASVLAAVATCIVGPIVVTSHLGYLARRGEEAT